MPSVAADMLPSPTKYWVHCSTCSRTCRNCAASASANICLSSARNQPVDVRMRVVRR